ncbi:uncharacterized protein DNG_06438 [Cephalotrichum gorgonifer]|uniref:Transcriptional activator n=1 Tax=Cephalotrichum gorgonifer TaxID=2041049 RepID=A0AAE8MZY1_9PEZI|nr:uncharacterized protein DNG_06438 [Cephalotrichum gorgonifer]
MAASTGKAGIIVPPNNDGDALDQVAYAVLDDILYNIIQDILSKTHMEEKLARAATASIRVEKLASDAADGAPDSKPDVRIETDAAIYEDGKVMLKGNPLKTTKDVLCPRCHLPRLLYPTDGKGARKPDPGGIYCKKHPYIDKPGYDIYGQTWVPQGPGRGKKKKDQEKKSDDPGGPDQRPTNVLSFPSATCIKCKRCILVTRLNNHMGGCIGNSGRSASRAAAQKISNGSNGGNSQDATPPPSQKGTPRPGSRASSPRKRDADQVEDDDSSDNAPKKKKLKASAAATPSVKIKIKPPKPGGLGGLKDKVKASSNLSVEHKPNRSPKTKNLEAVPPKKVNAKVPSPLKKSTKLVAKALMSSPAKNGRAVADSASDSSGGGSSPPHR